MQLLHSLTVILNYELIFEIAGHSICSILREQEAWMHSVVISIIILSSTTQNEPIPIYIYICFLLHLLQVCIFYSIINSHEAPMRLVLCMCTLLSIGTVLSIIFFWILNYDQSFVFDMSSSSVPS